MKTVELILSENSDRDIDEVDEFGWTLLHHAVYHGRESLVDLLLDRGANVGAKSSKWATEWGRPSGLYQDSDWTGQPLHLAAMFSRKEIVEKLLKAGADVNAKSIDIDTKGWRSPSQGPTALHLTLSTGTFYSGVGHELDDTRMRIAQILIDNGAEVEGVVDHLKLSDVLRFEAWEELWDKLRVGITERATTTTIVLDN
jgi:ankyrin repeat protein